VLHNLRIWTPPVKWAEIERKMSRVPAAVVSPASEWSAKCSGP
jgi:hypothetical protein